MAAIDSIQKPHALIERIELEWNLYRYEIVAPFDALSIIYAHHLYDIIKDNRGRGS